MFKVTIKPQWQVQAPSGETALPRLVELLVGIHETGSLAGACARANISYRYAWGILREGEKTLGAALVSAARGSGAHLTALGKKLVWADKRIAARLSPLLDSLSSEIEVEFEHAFMPGERILRIHATHGFAVEALHRFMNRRQIAADLKYRSSMDVLASLVRDSCDLAGLHLPIGEYEAPMLKLYAPSLKQGDFVVIDLVTRHQGIMVAHGNPKKIREVRDLARRGVRFVNRQHDSATRALLDLLLAKTSIDGNAINGYDNVEFTHAAVAAYVASGMADAGFGLETPAQRFGLDYIPILRERYFFLCPRPVYETQAVDRVLAILRSNEFRKVINALPGYDGEHCGRALDVLDAFPSLQCPDMLSENPTCA
jgi:molybdate transport repressor ModE-like protein